MWGALGQALSFAFGMFWEFLWALILGFALSGVVQAVVSKQEMQRLFHRKYYGWKMAAFLLASFYTTMVTAGIAVEPLFKALRLTPNERHAKVVEASVTWSYTTFLNIFFLGLGTPRNSRSAFATSVSAG